MYVSHLCAPDSIEAATWSIAAVSHKELNVECVCLCLMSCAAKWSVELPACQLDTIDYMHRQTAPVACAASLLDTAVCVSCDAADVVLLLGCTACAKHALKLGDANKTKHRVRACPVCGLSAGTGKATFHHQGA